MSPAVLRRLSSLALLGALICFSAGADGSPAIRLRNLAVENTTLPSPNSAPSTGRLQLIQFKSAPTPQRRAELEHLGVRIIRYVPDDAFLVRAEPAILSEVRALGFVAKIEPYQSRLKFEGRVQRQLALRTNTTFEVAVLLAPESQTTKAANLRARFDRVDHEVTLPTGRILRGQIDAAQLETLAADDEVLWIEPAPQMRLYDEVSSRIVAGDGPGNQTLMQSLGYDGSGVTVAVADSGLDSGDTNSMHADIQGRVRKLFFYGAPGQLSDAADEHSHGTHCAGIIAGNGATGETDENGYLYGLGVAPGATLIGQRIFDGAGGYAPPPSFETLTRDAKREGADIGSNSWGDDTQGQYDLSAMEFDALVRDADILTLGDQQYILEFSAGNAGPGYQTIGSPAVAKNVIATGASQNDRFNLPIEEFAIYADGRDAMADFSSRGPCADGRIKPDLIAPGSWIASLRSVYANDDFAWWPISDNYMYQGGTSQAGPQVSGAAAVFVQYWRSTHTNTTPSPALVKAALINSAADVDDGLTTIEAVPNNDEGWGRVDLPALIGSTRDYDFIDQSVLLTNDGVFEQRILVGSSDEPLKITLTYTDVPGFPAAAVALVNDLDLEVVSPTGTIFRGNQFIEGESVPDAPLPDTINNVEAVHLSKPAPGEYLIRVRGRRVVEDARTDSAAIDQDFALATSGSFANPGVGIVSFNRSVYRAPDQIQLVLVDYHLAGLPSANIQLRSDTESTGESVTLFASGSSGLFTNTIATATGTPSVDGKLQVTHGDLIEAVYQDAAPAAQRIYSVTADLNPPVISGLQATNQFGQLFIDWTTDEEARAEVYYGQPALNFAVTNRLLDLSQSIPLPNVAPGATVKYFVVAQDLAGNRSTNNNGGLNFTATNSTSLSVLLLDSYTDYGGLIPAPPLSGYTDALNVLGVSYSIFDARSGSFPSANQLNSYRCVIWRTDELISPAAANVAAIANYVTNGGSLFIASMEFLTRLEEIGLASFNQNILQTQSHLEDQPVDEIAGLVNEPVGSGIDTTLDYTPYADLLFILSGGGIDDPSDWITPTTNATPVLSANGEVVGLRAPKTGVDLPGRVVLLSFPLDAVPLGTGIGNNRSGLLKSILDFLVPQANRSSIAMDSDVYSVPGLAVVEVEDPDQSGTGSLPISVTSPEHTNVLAVTLLETARAGLFRGNILFNPTNSNTPGVYAVNPNDTVVVSYFDASIGNNISATVTIETNAPIISNVAIDPGYLEAIVSWDTSKAADSLVQFGESPGNLPNNFVAYDPVPTTAHEVFLSGLKPNTTYFLRVTSRDRAGNTTLDDNGGTNYVFTTLQPLNPPWFDNLETNNNDWSVISSAESETGWTRGTPSGGETAHSGSNVWGSNLGGGSVSQFESYLISPGILLTGGNQATLHFWQNYDFLAQGEFDLQLAAIEIITNVTTAPIVLYQFDEDYSFGWEEMELDLTPYLGNVVYIVWYHFLFSFDAPPRLGWLVDDVSITTSTIVPGTVQVTNNLWQSVFALSGPSGRTGFGRSLVITNAAPGQYVIEYGDVPYYHTPLPQTNTLVAGTNITFVGNYTFTDVNTNGLPDSYETSQFGSLDSTRTQTTDTDQDGLSDYGEFVAGTDPISPPPPFAVSVEKLNSTLLQFGWASLPGHTYRVHSSPNGSTWTPATPWFPATGTNTTYTISTATNGPTKFFRLEAAAPVSALAGLFRVTATPLPGNLLKLDWPSAPGHGYRALVSTNTTSWQPASDWIRAGGYSSTITLPAAPSNAAAFFRIEAQP